MLGIFTTLTDPDRRGDCWLPAIQCYAELADEVVIVNGGTEKFLDLPDNVRVINSEWTKEFSWDLIGKKFTEGYNALNTRWAVHADIDFLFHERDFNLIRRTFEENPNEPALTFWKYQFILPDRYNLKSRLTIAVNKGKFGERIKFNSGGDLCQPSLDGRELNPNTVKEARIPFYNYEKLIKTREQVFDDVGRMARAWERYFNNTKLGSDEESAFDEWARMLKGRFDKPHQEIGLLDHPEFIIPYIIALNKNHFGYDGFGMLPINNYSKEIHNA